MANRSVYYGAATVTTLANERNLSCMNNRSYISDISASNDMHAYASRERLKPGESSTGADQRTFLGSLFN